MIAAADVKRIQQIKKNAKRDILKTTAEHMFTVQSILE